MSPRLIQGPDEAGASNGLRPCPFCGRLDTVRVQDWYDHVTHSWTVACWSNGTDHGAACQVYGPRGRTEAEARELWNRGGAK